jgi:ATP-dependent DNA helicase RecQ
VRPVVAQTALFRLMVDGVVEALPRGSLVDIRLKQGGLDGESRGEIAKRLKNRTRTSYKQIEHVEEYVNLSSCRRERLLRHFGDTEEVAPCAGCDFCLGEIEDAARALPERILATASAAAWTGILEPNGATVAPPVAYDAELFERLRAWRGDQARSQQVPAYVVLNNSHIEDIARRKPRNVHELGNIKGIGLRRAARYGEDLLALVRGEDPASVSETGSSPANTADGTHNSSASSRASGYRHHLEAAEHHLRTGSGAAAVPELARALELGGEEAKRAVDDLLAP